MKIECMRIYARETRAKRTTYVNSEVVITGPAEDTARYRGLANGSVDHRGGEQRASCASRSEGSNWEQQDYRESESPRKGVLL